MKFNFETLFGIAKEEYTAADSIPDVVKSHIWSPYIRDWAIISAEQEYKDEEEVREELRAFIAIEKKMFE